MAARLQCIFTTHTSEVTFVHPPIPQHVAAYKQPVSSSDPDVFRPGISSQCTSVSGKYRYSQLARGSLWYASLTGIENLFVLLKGSATRCPHNPVLNVRLRPYYTVRLTSLSIRFSSDSLTTRMLLAHRHTGKVRPTTVVLCLTILALFTSTTIYTVTSIIFYLSNFLNAFVSSGGTLWAYSSPVDFSAVPPTLLQENLATARLWACASPATLTTNVRLISSRCLAAFY